MNSNVFLTMLVFYNKSQQVDGMHHLSPSIGKPKMVLQSWSNLGMKIERGRVRPLSVEQLSLAHQKSYVQGVLSGRIENGFGNTDRQIAASLPWTTGSFVSAATYAMKNRICTYSPTSGFHHACYAHAAGYCTFSGLSIAAIILLTQHAAKRVGILDLDSHSGDGTDDTLAKAGYADRVEHYSLGYYKIDQSNNQTWIEDLPGLIRERFSDCDILFYQSGVDCHIDDPLVESGEFSTEQIQRREEIVFTTCREMGLPVVTNLAGGYQKPIDKVLKLHDFTALAQ